MSRRRKAPLNPLFLPSFRGGRWKVLAPWLKIWRIMTCKLLFMRSETIDSLSMSTSVVDMHGRMLRGHGNSLRSRSAKFHSSSDSIIKRALGKYIKLQLALKGTTATANGIFICFNFVMSAVKLLLPWFFECQLSAAARNEIKQKFFIRSNTGNCGKNFLSGPDGLCSSLEWFIRFDLLRAREWAAEIVRLPELNCNEACISERWLILASAINAA